jgi:hypothetical protein
MMQRLILAALAVVLLSSPAVQAADDVSAIVEKAIKAGGGEEQLKKFPAAQVKSQGKFYGGGADGVEFTIDQAYMYPGRYRFQIEVGGTVVRTQVIKGDKGWTKAEGGTEELGKDELKEAHEEMYARGLTHLLPLTDKGVKLSRLGEIKVGDRPAVGIRVEAKGHGNVSLYFDKESGLLVKSQRRVKEPGSGEEVTAETVYSNHKKVEGMPLAHKVTITHDGKKFVEAEVTEWKVFEKLPDSTFEKP